MKYKVIIVFILFVSVFSFLSGENKDLYSCEEYLYIGNKKQLFTDYFLIEPGYGVLSWKINDSRKPDNLPIYSPYGVKIVMSYVDIIPTNIIPSINKYKNGEIIGGYSTLLKDGDKYKLWYEAYDSDFRNRRLCYAESKDGIHWVKPDLGLIEFQGSKHNNIVIKGVGLEGTVFIDPKAPLSERYKYIYVGGALKKEEIEQLDLNKDPAATKLISLKAMVSSDGLKWKKLNKVLLVYKLDTQNVCFYDPFEKSYIAYVRGMLPMRASGVGSRRVVSRAVSKDFKKFSKPVVVVKPELYDSFDTDVYTNAAQLLPDAGQVYIALPAFYHRTSDDVEIMLYTSRDGIFWQRVSKEPFITVRKKGIIRNFQVYAGVGIVPIEKDRWAFPLSIIYAGHNTDFLYSQKEWREWGRIKLGVVRRDGFTAVEAESKGEFFTIPMVFKGRKLKVNVTGEEGGRIRVGIWDAKTDSPIKGYEIKDCDGIRTEAFYKTVSWHGNSDLSRLEGKPIRLRIELIRMRIHSFQFTD